MILIRASASQPLSEQLSDEKRRTLLGSSRFLAIQELFAPPKDVVCIWEQPFLFSYPPEGASLILTIEVDPDTTSISFTQLVDLRDGLVDLLKSIDLHGALTLIRITKPAQSISYMVNAGTSKPSRRRNNQ